MTFILSDEKELSNGKTILIDGIDITRFVKNPVMFYLHERPTIIGRWENVRKINRVLYADPVFDDTTETGKMVKAQVEKGFLNAASIGVDVLEEKTDEKGNNIITKCELVEASIVDVPANKNTVKLYNINGQKKLLLNFAEFAKPSLRDTIISLLSLSDNATDEEIINKIVSILSNPDEVTAEIDRATEDGYIYEVEKMDFLNMARRDPNLFKKFIAREKAKREKAVDKTIKDRHAPVFIAPILQAVGEKMGVEIVTRLLDSINRTPRVSEFLDGGDRSKWTLADYRKYRPKDLQENPKLYAELLERERNESVLSAPKDLDYYRKYRPEYLKENPDFYKKLLSTQK